MVLGLLWDLLVGVPSTLSREILRALREEIDRERLLTEGSVMRRLQEIQQMLESGELSEAEYDELEEQLMQRLRALRKGG
jgi:predicted DNA-binding protein (UPF0278 family)